MTSSRFKKKHDRNFQLLYYKNFNLLIKIIDIQETLLLCQIVSYASICLIEYFRPFFKERLRMYMQEGAHNNFIKRKVKSFGLEADRRFFSI